MKINLSNLGITYNFQYEAFIIQQQNYNLKFEYSSNLAQKHFLILQYNSSTKPNISLKINNNLVNSNLININTKSHNKLLSFRIQLGPFEFIKGVNLIELCCLGSFPLLYSIEIVENEEIINSNFLIENIFKLRMSDFILLENYNPYGGFYWHIYNFIICNLVCEKFSKIPIVNFNGSLYLSNTNEINLINNNTNWFYNYFNYDTKLPFTIHNIVTKFKSRVNFNNLTTNQSTSDDFIYYFDYNTFANFNHLFLSKSFSDKKKYIQDKFILQDYIKTIIAKIKNDILPKKTENIKFIGIHYRGTDKIEEGGNDEEHPIHYNYEIVYQKLEEKIQSFPTDIESYIIVTTDEIPFVHYMKEKFGEKIIYYQEANRSDINTSGLNYNFQKTPPRNKIYDKRMLQGEARNELVLKEKLIQKSIHMGSKHLSNYKKGLDCIIDVIMLENCDVIYKSKGNFSNFCTYLNKKSNLEVIELHDFFSYNY